MKLRFLFIAVLALLASGCMDTVMAVPAAAVSGVGSVVGGIWGASLSDRVKSPVCNGGGPWPNPWKKLNSVATSGRC